MACWPRSPHSWPQSESPRMPTVPRSSSRFARGGDSTHTGRPRILPPGSGRALGTGPTFDAPYWMEAPLWQAVCPTLVCGPSGGGLHALDEWVDVRQVQAYAASLPGVLTSWAAGRRADRSRRAARGRAADRRVAAVPGGGDDAVHHPGTQAAARPRRRCRRGRRPALCRPRHDGAQPRRPGRGGVPGSTALGRGCLPVLGPRATHANQALALALAGTTCGATDCDGHDNGTVVVSRTLHRSMILVLVLAGLTPVWVRPEVDAATGLPLGVAPTTVADALDRQLGAGCPRR